MKSIFAELDFTVDQDKENPEFFWGTWSTESFAAPNGEKHILLAFELTSDGNYFRVMAPEVYDLKDSKFKGHALAVLAQIAFGVLVLQLLQEVIVGFSQAPKHLRRLGQAGADAVRQLAIPEETDDPMSEVPAADAVRRANGASLQHALIRRDP